MNKSIEIFSTKEFENCQESSFAPIASIQLTPRGFNPGDSSLSDGFEDVLIRNPSHAPNGTPLLQFSCRTKAGVYHLFSVIFNGREEERFTLRDIPLGETVAFIYPREANRSTRLPSLIFVDMRRTTVDGQETPIHTNSRTPKSIRDGFPLLHYTTTLDLDDGVGLLAIGTGRGHLCFARFLPDGIISGGSFIDELPTHRSNQGELSAEPVAMDIPAYYHCHRGQMEKPVKDIGVIRDVTIHWPVPENIQDINPWSCNWEKFEAAYDWVAPTNRWPANDPEFSIWIPTTASACISLTTFGDIIPLAYRLDSDIVLFRVGPRLYFSSRDEEDGEPILSFSALPISFEASVLDGRLLEAYRQPDVLKNMWGKRYKYRGISALVGAARRMEDLIDTVNRHPDEFEATLERTGDDPDLWTSDDLKLIADKWLFVDD
ncbi:hypothetical protein SCHPADRAFT_477003 [Schizopora paradoxa]|uniref:Uncharacterized protein n=1 Tax=Schizopora paradoxa TaxID=27342 RepID=A0A0H2RHD4_9AGAM|nr:hypothetical protein SCHPADRAFT_477003 [Schizopora paradoxa]